MPNNSVRAAAEGMPDVNRRRLLLGLASASAVAATAPIPQADATPLPATPYDPLIAHIADFRSGVADYNANAPEDDDEADAYADVTYGPPLKILSEWEAPAMSLASAIEALRLAASESEDFAGSPVGRAMLRAALGYFERA
jgi:hypothetical protein